MTQKTILLIAVLAVLAAATQASCPADKPMTSCFVDPCQFASCPRDTKGTAVCISDYCGGCNYFYQDPETKLRVEC